MHYITPMDLELPAGLDMTDMDLTVGAGKFLIMFTAPVSRDSSSGGCDMEIQIDGVSKVATNMDESGPVPSCPTLKTLS